MLYRIITENKPETIDKLRSIVNGRFKNFTTIYANGYYESEYKPIVIFEIDSDCDVGLVRNVAADIRDINQQETVMLQVILNTFTYMVGSTGQDKPRQEHEFKKGLAP